MKSDEDLWGGRVPPDLTGIVIAIAVATAVVSWPAHDPGSPARGLLLVSIATGLSVTAWSSVMGLSRRRSDVVRVALATFASGAAVASYLAARSSSWPVMVLVVLTVTSRLERPPGHRLWRHVAIGAAALLGGLVALTI